MAAKTGDSRFARLQTDPRFRRPKQKNVKVEIDDRFKDVLQSEEFGGKAKGKGKGKGKASDGARVDKRGRPIAASHEADQLKRFYRLKSPSPSGEQPGFVDYARGEGNLESSGSESEASESEVEEEQLELGGKKLNRLPQHNLPSGSESDSESGSDGSHLDINLSETEDVPAEEDEDEDDEEDGPSIPPTKRIAAVNLDWDNLRAADLYSVFNSFLNIKRKGESSSSGLGRLVDVKIYPSQFGKERMEKEEQEGPGGGIFVGNAGRTKKRQGIILDSDDDHDEEDDGQDEESDDEEDGSVVDELDLDEGDEHSDAATELSDDEDGLADDDDEDVEEEDEDDDEEDEDTGPSGKHNLPDVDGLEILSDVSSEPDEGDIDMDKLRQYQLERLRYFYAVASFSSVAAAEHVMTECNGTEFERTANMFDLSYVPDEMDFGSDEVKDEASRELKGYKGNDFVTDALRHSKVKLTWDQDDPNRAKMTRRTLTREEIDEQDFNNLVASSGSEDEAEGTANVAAGKGSDKKSKKDRSKDLRALLFNNDSEDDDVWGKAGTAWKEELAEVRGQGKEAKANGDMEITFRPALSGSKALDGADEENMTTLERYQMRMKEKKARKKEKRELKRAGKLDGSDDDEVDAEAKEAKEDEFFGDTSDEEDEQVKAAARPSKPSKANKAEADTKSPAVPSAQPRSADDLPEDLQTGTDHFSMKDILRAEKEKGKRKRRRNKKGGKHEDEREVELGPEGWRVDVQDERFKVLHEEPEFAIDPSNPAFTKTQGMKDLLAERARIRSVKPLNEPVGKRVFKEDAAPAEKDLSSLVQSVKRRMDGQQKTRKRSRK